MILTRTKLSNYIDIAYMISIGVLIIFFLTEYYSDAREEERDIKTALDRQTIIQNVLTQHTGMFAQNEKIICLSEEILDRLDNRYKYASDISKPC